MRKLWAAAATAAVAGAAVMLPWWGPVRRRAIRSDNTPPAPLQFPQQFLWGVATAAHQVETRTPNDWTAFEERALQQGLTQRAPGSIHNLHTWPSEVLQRKTDHVARVHQDVALMASLGVKAYRFSVEWARLFPTAAHTTPDPQGLAFYVELVTALKAANITPVVTLFHFTTPQWLWEEHQGHRGLERDDAVEHFERFVSAVARALGAHVTLWCTLNEPMVYAYQGYLQGIFPPLEKRGDPKAVAPVIVQLARMHAAAYAILKKDAAARGITNQVGLTQHTRHFLPARNLNPLDRATAMAVSQVFMWDFLDALETGTLAFTTTGMKKHIEGLAGTQDYVGLNYYGRFYLRSDVLHPQQYTVLDHDDATDTRVNDLGWALDPAGFRATLRTAHQRYHKPIYVMEAGTADAQDDDRLRQWFLVTHATEMWHAIQNDGVDVRGLFVWSLMDNFEWAEGFEGRFGLHKVDYRGNFKRTRRPSADLYESMARNGAVTPEMLARFPRHMDP